MLKQSAKSPIFLSSTQIWINLRRICALFSAWSYDNISSITHDDNVLNLLAIWHILGLNLYLSFELKAPLRNSLISIWN